MIPVIALVGRPNVGKSTLFNCLTQTRNALVSDMPGMTRDRNYGDGRQGGFHYIVIDTGGIGSVEDKIDELMEQQTLLAIKEADIILFMVDAKDGLTASDEFIARNLHKTGKKIHLVMNKIDGVEQTSAAFDFHALGLGDPLPIAAAHKRGVNVMLETVFKDNGLLEAAHDKGTEEKSGIRIAIVGKPNVGKSTLINRILGEERVIVFDSPGTTRDSIFIPLERHDKQYTLIDTAGVRRKKNISALHEKFSVIKTLQAIEASNVVIMVIDAKENITDHDLHMLGFILETGKSLILCVNKWDGLDEEIRESVKQEINRRLDFVDFAELFFISALHGTNVGLLFTAVDKAYESANRIMPTNDLTNLLTVATTAHPPPMINGRRIKLRYAHTGGHNPPIIVIHGNQVERIPQNYERYLTNFFRKELKLVGTPIRFEFKSSENPYKDQHNTLTPRQAYRKQRQMKYLKKKNK